MNRSDQLRHVVLVLGDQLDPRSAAFDGFDSDRDLIWMAEVERETTHVWCHRRRIALFIAAMRHFRDALQNRVLGEALRVGSLRSGGVTDHRVSRALGLPCGRPVIHAKRRRD